MVQPLEYRSPRVAKDPIETTPKGPRVAIPIDFDVVVARTRDHAAASAIENQLKASNIPVFRTHDGPAVDQMIQLLVRSADREVAGVVANSILSRREKIKTLLRR